MMAKKYLLLNMRLTEFEIECITNLAVCHFGTDVQVFLFGSRTKDQKRGGDIDLFISDLNDKPLKIRSKINFISDLIIKIGDQKIDVVLDSPCKKNSVFFKTIYRTRIQLC